MRALLLNSTQPKHPHAGLGWVRATLRAIDELAGQGHSFVASTGTIPWELALWRISRVRAPVQLICPMARSHSEADVRVRIERDFDLDPTLASWQFLRSGKPSERLKDTWLLRDAAALDAAEGIFPISIRNKGKLQTALQNGEWRNRTDARYQVAYERGSGGRPWQLADLRTEEQPSAPMLMHFTRACDGPWPGESRAQFYASIAQSPDRYPRDGLATLRRIVDEASIRASTFRIRGHGSTVSFTALDPSDALSLVRWRSRYARFSFEPYAIGISREAAVRAGVKPVIYDQGATRGASANESTLHQGRGEAGGWEAEREWRVDGNVDLAAFDPSEVVVFTATALEAASLRSRIPFRVADFGCASG